MRYLNATQAAKFIGVTDRTIRDWIKDGKLTAHHPAPNRLAIAVTDVERIARERKQYDVSIPDAGEIAQRLADLEQKYQDLMLKYQEMAQELATIRSVAPAFPLQQEMFTDIPHSKPPKKQRAAQTARAREELPPGCVLASEFAERHNVNRVTFRDHMLKGLRGERVEVSERPKPGREHETERYLTPEQQFATLDFWRRQNVQFQEPQEEE